MICVLLKTPQLTNNVDSYIFSTYLNVELFDDIGAAGILKMGPPWDFNLAFGNLG